MKRRGATDALTDVGVERLAVEFAAKVIDKSLQVGCHVVREIAHDILHGLSERKAVQAI